MIEENAKWEEEQIDACFTRKKRDEQNFADTRIKLICHTVGLGKEKGFKLQL